MKITSISLVFVSLLGTSCLETLNDTAPPPSPHGFNSPSQASQLVDPNAGLVASGSSFEADRAEFLRLHNQARADVGAAPLAWSQQLADHAQQWAEELARRDQMVHRSDNPYGENLAAGSNVDVAGGCRMWLAERSAYDGGAIDGGNFSAIGHYTQMIWGTTTHVGYGIARNGRNTYIVANYSPAGNVIGQRP